MDLFLNLFEILNVEEECFLLFFLTNGVISFSSNLFSLLLVSIAREVLGKLGEKDVFFCFLFFLWTFR